MGVLSRHASGARRPRPARLLLLALLPVALAAGRMHRVDQQAPRDIRVLHVANAGFLIVIDGKKVLIDALFALPSPTEPPPDVLQRLESGQAPFDSLDLILATHDHRDHFRAESVVRALAHNPRAVFLSTPQAVARLQALGSAFASVQGRVRTLDLPTGRRTELAIRGLQVRVTSTGHSGMPAVQNYMYLIASPSGSIVHPGDGAGETTFDPDAFGPDGVDVGFFHYGLLVSAEWLRRIDTVVRPRHLIPMHVHASQRRDADVRLGELMRSRNDVHYLRESLASATLARR